MLFINRGVRLIDLSLSELVSFVYATRMKEYSEEDRHKYDLVLAGPTEEELDVMPERLKGITPPSWWLATETITE